jgi:hypothetical protein
MSGAGNVILFSGSAKVSNGNIRKAVNNNRMKDKNIFFMIFLNIIRTYFKKIILAQVQGGSEFQTAGILKYVEDLKRGPTQKLGQKTFLRWVLFFKF